MTRADDPPLLRVEVLGPLRLVVRGVPVEVRGPKRRAVLALLALAEGRAVPVDHLVDALWPGEVPESGRQALHSHVSRLRGHLGPAAARLETLDGGYRLALDGADLDAAQARALLARARAHTGQDPAAAAALLRGARALWRGPVLADLGEVAPVAAAGVALEQLHRDVTDALVAAATAAARDDPAQVEDVVGLATAALAADPLREPAALALVRVLAVTGRAGEALAVAREFRHRLAEETGLDPSAALDALERDVARGAAGPPPPEPPAAPPRPGTRLFGREGLVAAVHRLLARERLVALVGPGGVGKTRVALEVAATRPATAPPATVLLLAPVTDPAAVPHALAAALALQVVQGDVLAACAAVLRARPALLVVDNCEHVLDAARDTAAALLDTCPDLTVLVTSREPLGLAEERVTRLDPLPVPDDGAADPARAPAVAVFLDRAARVRPDLVPGPDDLRLVAAVVRRLDGMPLAIELAAGRLSTFSLADLHDRLDRALDLLGGGRRAADARHRTLRDTVDWSYRLLGDDERALFRHLSVFPDGVDLATAEGVAADLGLAGDPGSVLARLVDASVVQAAHEGRPRYRMLETLRAFGLDRLAAAGEDGAARARLVRRAVDLATGIARTVPTEREPEADAALRRELPTLRAAWRLVRAADGLDYGLDDAVTMVVALYEVGLWRDVTEVWGWSEELVADPRLRGHPQAAEVLGAAAEVAYLRGDHPRADALAREGLRLDPGPEGTRLCRASLAVAALSRGAWAEAREHAGAAAAAVPARGSQELVVAVLAAVYAGDLPQARVLHARAAAGAVSPTVRGFCSYAAGEIEGAAGAWDRAEQHYAEATALARRSGATYLDGIASVGMLSALVAAGRTADALRGYRDLLDYWAVTGQWTHLWVTLRNLADLLEGLGDGGPAAALHAAADRAPDAPAPAPGRTPAATGPAPGREEALELARAAVGRHLAGAGPQGAGANHSPATSRR